MALHPGTFQSLKKVPQTPYKPVEGWVGFDRDLLNEVEGLSPNWVKASLCRFNKHTATFVAKSGTAPIDRNKSVKDNGQAIRVIYQWCCQTPAKSPIFSMCQVC